MQAPHIRAIVQVRYCTRTVGVNKKLTKIRSGSAVVWYWYWYCQGLVKCGELSTAVHSKCGSVWCSTLQCGLNWCDSVQCGVVSCACAIALAHS